MKSKRRKFHSQLDLQQKNASLRLKIQEETGIPFNRSGNLSPELENKYLENVLEFEKQFKTAPDITVSERLGKPEFPKEAELDDQQLIKELKNLESLMNKNNIFCDCICEVPPRDYYRFLSEELMNVEMQDIRIPGMNQHYIYEEFHPSAELDTRDLLRYLIDAFKENSFRGEYSLFDIKQLKNIEEVLQFRKKFTEISVCEYINYKFQRSEESLTALFDFKLEGLATGSGETIFLSGQGTAHYLYKEDHWEMNEIDLPGMKGEKR